MVGSMLCSRASSSCYTVTGRERERERGSYYFTMEHIAFLFW
jgi:hypothetical protein